MRTLRNTLYISLTLQICIAAAILAVAEEAPLALATLPLAVVSLFVIDLLRWFVPPRWLLNIASLISLGFALMEFRHEGESRLLAGAHLIVYLTWTFLLQEKDLRRMWWLFALSVLQVAIGGVLTSQPWYGAALFVYTASAVWTMSLLSLTRAALLTESNLLSLESKEPQAEERVHAPLSLQSSSQNGVRTDDHGRWISPRFIGGGVLTFGLVLIVAMTFFVLTPRVWISRSNIFGDSPLRRGGGATGFTENVKLGDIGHVMESQELVMRVKVLDGETERPLAPSEIATAVGDEPLFRGAVLDHYSAGSWKASPYREGQSSYDGPGFVRLNITLQPLNSEYLFYPGTLIGAESVTEPESLIFHRFSQVLKRSDESDFQSPFSYSVVVIPPSTVIPQVAESREWTRNAIRASGFSPRMLGHLAPPPDRLVRLARQVLDRSPQTGESDSESTARVLEAYLRDSDEFRYTLNLSVEDPKIDPVEDFVFNRKKGHCEYFASALALMLRGVGIPSRLISGFKGAEYNTSSGMLEVRALHAHAWVEGFVDGGWVTFDPTPGLRDTEVATKAKEVAPNLVNQSMSVWFQGMSYNKSQQDELVYAPLRNLGQMIQTNFAGLMQGELPLIGQLKNLADSPRRWFRGEAGVLAPLMALLVLGGLIGVIWAVRKRWKKRTRQNDPAQRRAITVEFYSRLLRVLQRYGLHDIQTLTPREFASRAETQFEARFQSAGVTGLPHALVESFYAVRFGEQPLTADQLRMVDQQLGQLEQGLAQPVTG